MIIIMLLNLPVAEDSGQGNNKNDVNMLKQ